MSEMPEKPISKLVTPELFAAYIGKDASAVRRMARDGKLPVIRMRDPEKSTGAGEIYIAREAWDDYVDELLEAADIDWHLWKERLTTEKPEWVPRKSKKAG